MADSHPPTLPLIEPTHIFNLREACEEFSKASLHESQASSGRRDSQRVAYPYLQWLAPCTDDKVPALRDFQQVCCRDISTSGFSYLSPTTPDTQFVVVALGSGSLLRYLVAEVVHSQPIEKDGDKQFAVGCRYTGRLAYD